MSFQTENTQLHAILFQTDLTVIKQANPDAVFVADNPDMTPLVIQQGWNDVGLKTIYIAVENNQDPVFYSLLGSVGRRATDGVKDGSIPCTLILAQQCRTYSAEIQPNLRCSARNDGS